MAILSRPQGHDYFAISRDSVDLRVQRDFFQVSLAFGDA